MNSKYRSTLCESKKLNASGLLQKANANHITADKILYDHAIHMVICNFKLIRTLVLTFDTFSARLQLWMNYLVIQKNASQGTNRHKSYFIH